MVSQNNIDKWILMWAGIFLFIILFPLITNAALPGFGKSIVPCGLNVEEGGTKGPENAECTTCHSYVLASNIITFFTVIMVPLAVMAIVIGAIMLITGGGNEGRITKGKDVIRYALTGIIVILLAWLIINTVMYTLAKNGGKFQVGEVIYAWNEAPDCPGKGRIDFTSSEEPDALVANESNDRDGDGLLNEEEDALCTSPDNEDTDGDGLNDLIEVRGLKCGGQTDVVGKDSFTVGTETVNCKWESNRAPCNTLKDKSLEGDCIKAFFAQCGNGTLDACDFSKDPLSDSDGDGLNNFCDPWDDREGPGDPAEGYEESMCGLNSVGSGSFMGDGKITGNEVCDVEVEFNDDGSVGEPIIDGTGNPTLIFKDPKFESCAIAWGTDWTGSLTCSNQCLKVSSENCIPPQGNTDGPDTFKISIGGSLNRVATLKWNISSASSCSCKFKRVHPDNVTSTKYRRWSKENIASTVRGWELECPVDVSSGSGSGSHDISFLPYIAEPWGANYVWSASLTCDDKTIGPDSGKVYRCKGDVSESKAGCKLN